MREGYSALRALRARVASERKLHALLSARHALLTTPCTSVRPHSRRTYARQADMHTSTQPVSTACARPACYVRERAAGECSTPPLRAVPPDPAGTCVHALRPHAAKGHNAATGASAAPRAGRTRKMGLRATRTGRVALTCSLSCPGAPFVASLPRSRCLRRHSVSNLFKGFIFFF